MLNKLKPGPQSQKNDFKKAFPSFEDDLNEIKSMPSDKFKVFIVNKAFVDKDGLPVPSASYRDENDILNIYVTKGNIKEYSIGLFHELYENEILKGNQNAHTLA